MDEMIVEGAELFYTEPVLEDKFGRSEMGRGGQDLVRPTGRRPHAVQALATCCRSSVLLIQ